MVRVFITKRLLNREDFRIMKELNDMKEIGAKLKELRLMNKETTYTLVNKGIRVTQTNAVESGKAVSIATLVNYCNAVGIKIKFEREAE